MIPMRWYEERARLAALAYAQSKEDYELAPDEKPVQLADIEALAATPITAEEIAAFTSMRGEYRPGDTRAFVFEQEQRCTNWNSWMRRDVGGIPLVYLSEEPQRSAQ